MIIYESEQDAEKDGQRPSFSFSEVPDNFVEKDDNKCAQCIEMQKTLARWQKKNKQAKNTLYVSARRSANKVEGCQPVSIASLAAPVTGLEGVDMVAMNEDSERQAALGQKKAKHRRVQNEVATEKLIVESRGGKAIRRSADGHKLGGLEWKDTEMAAAVANWSLDALSFKAAAKTSNAALRRKGVRFWFQAAPRRSNQTRRLPKNRKLPLVDISYASMRDGVFAMELAKNYWLYVMLRTAEAVALCSDLTTTGDNHTQATYIRLFKFQDGGTDGAGTVWLIVVATSMVLDLWPVGDKLLNVATYEDDSGVQRELPVEAPRALAAQLIYAGIYWIIMACRCLSLTFDGGGEGTGLGNRERARETMAGENSYLDLVWLTKSAADSAFDMLNNRARVFGPLMGFYGYDWENGDFSSRRQGSQSLLAPDGNQRPSAFHDLTEGPDPDVETVAAPRSSSIRPIFDPLAGPLRSSILAQPPKTLFDFIPWDIACAFPFLGLAETANDITEDMVERTEFYMECLMDTMFENVLDERVLTVSKEGIQRLRRGKFVSTEAVFYVMAPMTLALGGRLLVGGGGYMDETPSPLIQVALIADKIYVLEPIAAATLVCRFDEETNRIGYFHSQRALPAAYKPLKLGPEDTVFAGVHRPNHFVSMLAENLGGADSTAARMTVADSLPSPSFNCRTHHALRIAFREMKLIGKEHEVKHFGLALPEQDRPDCAFYMLIYLATVLTGITLRPELWCFLARIMRCWTFFLIFREQLHLGAIGDAMTAARRVFDSRSPTSPDAVADSVLADRYTQAPVEIVMPVTAAKDAARNEGVEKAVEKTADQARRKRRAQDLQAMSATTAVQASKGWKPLSRPRPRQLSTEGAVFACKTPPMCVRGRADSEEKWRSQYDPLRTMASPNPAREKHRRLWPTTSMFKSPARYFAMVKQDQQNPVPPALWCLRHRFSAWSQHVFKSQDRYPELAESCITCV